MCLHFLLGTLLLHWYLCNCALLLLVLLTKLNWVYILKVGRCAEAHLSYVEVIQLEGNEHTENTLFLRMKIDL